MTSGWDRRVRISASFTGSGEWRGAGVKFAHSDLAHSAHRTEPPQNFSKVGSKGTLSWGTHQRARRVVYSKGREAQCPSSIPAHTSFP